MFRFASIAVVLLFGSNAYAQDGFKPLFNGKDLSGWVNVNCAPNTWFVKDDMIITTGKPTGYLRTDRQYENFILEFEWFHAPSPKGSVGNSGLFVWGDPIPAVGTGYTRSIEVQVLVNLEARDKKTGGLMYTSHGDLFSIWGAKCKPDRPHPLGWERCLPSDRVCKGEYEWNHYKVVANDGTLKLTVNGKEVSGVYECKPRKGYLALESEGSECRFKNIKIKELPTTNPKADEICDQDKGFKCLFTGLDLAGWKANDEHKKHWKMADGVLNFDGKTNGDLPLWTEKSFGDFELVCDFRVAKAEECAVLVRGAKREVAFKDKKPGVWHRAVVRMQGSLVSLSIDKEVVADNADLRNVPAVGPLALVSDGAVQFRNVFIRELK